MKLLTSLLPLPATLSIRQRIVAGYLAMLGVISFGAAIGWTVGNHYQIKALEEQIAVSNERQFLEDLHLAILLVRPATKLLPVLESPKRFRQESQILLSQLLSVRSLIELHKEESPVPHENAGQTDVAFRRKQTIHQFLSDYKSSVITVEERLFETLNRAKEQLSKPNGAAQAREEIINLTQSQEFIDYINFSDQLFEWQLRLREQESAAVETHGQSKSLRINIVVLSILISLVIALLLSMWLSRIITDPIREVVRVSQRITDQNDFDIRIPIHQKDEIGKLSYTLNTLLEKVQGLLGEVNDKNHRLETTLSALHDQKFLFINDKMSSLSQLVAGIAHEVNNPMTFIQTNIPHLQSYFEDLLTVIETYEASHPEGNPEVEAITEHVDLMFLREDMPRIFRSLITGTNRISQIVLSLRSFARMDEAECKTVDIHTGLDSTLVMLQHRLVNEWHADGVKVEKRYGTLPYVECYAGQMNQVFLNILVNALDALDQQFKKTSQSERPAGEQPLGSDPSDIEYHGTIFLETRFLSDEEQVEIAIGNDGPSIPPALQERIFDPFFTTKAVGQGTGMGMSISHQIVTENHKGSLSCISPAADWGVKFVIRIPIRQRLGRGSLTVISREESPV